MSLPNHLISLPSLAEIVDRSPLTIHPDRLVATALALMSQAQGSHCELLAVGADRLEGSSYIRQHSCVLVTEGSELCGILTERDILRLTAQQRDLATTRVGCQSPSIFSQAVHLAGIITDLTLVRSTLPTRSD